MIVNSLIISLMLVFKCNLNILKSLVQGAGIFLLITLVIKSSLVKERLFGCINGKYELMLLIWLIS